MSDIYYSRLQEVDETLQELVNLKNELYSKILKERDEAIEKANLEFESKVEFLQARFDISAEKALGRLGSTIPAEVKAARKKQV
jgi:hypothetical protein